MQIAERERKYREYLTHKINPILEPLTKELLKQQPENVHDFIINFVQQHQRDPASVATRSHNSYQPSSNYNNNSSSSQGGYSSNYSNTNNYQNNSSSAKQTNQPKKEDLSDEDDDDEEQDDFIPISELQKHKANARSSVSAEAYGKYNQKSNFQPRIINKTPEQRTRIMERLQKAFMFASLDPKEQDFIINSMEEKKVNANEWIIKQGDEGDNLYVIDKGTLECYKQLSQNSQPERIKTYNPGESFGELALLYNAPRAASIKTSTDCVLFALDRDTFNHIVKDAIVRRRQRFEDTLSKIELLDTMDPYERSKIADVAIPTQIKAGDYVIRQGEPGEKFYFIEEGNAVATKILPGRNEPEVVYNYGPGDYFGELALLRGEARAANVVAKTHLSLLALDRVTFDRVLGPLNAILKRNTKKYEKFM